MHVFFYFRIFSLKCNKSKTRYNYRLIGLYSDKADINVKLDEVMSTLYHFK